MKVRLYKNKKLIENTPRPMGLQEPLMYAFSAKTADYAFAEGEEIPSAINSEYAMMETEVDDAELNKTYSDAKAEGYQGDITAVAKLMAMGIPLNMRAAVDIIPTSNIPYNTIRDTLNASSGVVNNNTWTAFQTTSGIDMWAKYKPVGYTADFPAYDSGWYKGNDKLCGLNIPNVNGDPEPIKNATWSYNPPKGGQTEPFRLGDFRGYNRKCQFFITGWWKKQTIKLQKGDALLTVQCAVLRPTQTNNLQIEDVELLANIRLALKITGGGRSWIKTSANKGADVSHDSGILQCQVNFDEEVPFSYDTGLYTVTQFLTTSDYSTLGTFPTIIQSYAMPNYYEGDFVNEQQVQYISVADGFEILAEALSNSLNGTYNDAEYYMNNPFKVKAGSYEYWKCKLTNKNQKETKTFNLSTLHYYSTNASGADVEDNGADVDSSELKLYNSTQAELSTRQITIGANTSVTIYIRTRLFSKQATITSGMSPLTVLTYANYTDKSLNINNRISCRFECRIQGSL